MERIALSLALLLTSCSTEQATPEQAAARALAWLFAQQDDEGRVFSDYYGVLRPGFSLTATALLAAARLPESLRAPHRDAIDKAFAFLADNTEGNGAVGLGGDVIDYPCYTSAHYLHALVLLRPRGYEALAARQVQRLRDIQLGPAQGWQLGDPQFGAFGFGTKPERKPLGADLINLPLQRAVIEALVEAGIATDDSVIRDGVRFVRHCQVRDSRTGQGEFFFTPAPVHRVSKAGHEDDDPTRPIPYGTTTCDGIRALLAAAPDTLAPRERSLLWLAKGGGFERVPRLGVSSIERSIRLYYLATLADTLRELAGDWKWRERLTAALLPRQQANGSFLGLASEMKEDDPAVATLLALLALGAALSR